jgi:hypothetical protein
LRNFFAPLKSKMELEESKGDQQEPSRKINLTFATNLLQLQKNSEDLSMETLSSATLDTEPKLSQKKLQTFQPWSSFSRTRNSFFTFHPES